MGKDEEIVTQGIFYKVIMEQVRFFKEFNFNKLSIMSTRLD